MWFFINRDEALILLSFHSGRNPDINNPKWENGFIGSLRHFNGKLNENNFIEIMECLKVLSEDFDSDKIDRDFMADIYGILYLTNLWLGKGGRLENIDPKYKNKIDIWMKIYSYAIELLLEYSEQSCEEAFYEYEDYLKGNSNYE